MNENMLVALLQTHTDFGYHVQVLRFSYSQNLLNYLGFKYFDFATLRLLMKVISETRRAH
jgi:hypothetical protein